MPRTRNAVRAYADRVPFLKRNLFSSKLFGIGLGIAVLLPLLSHMSVRFFKEPPDYEKYSPYEYYQPSKVSKEEAAAKNKEAKKKTDEYKQLMDEYNRFVFYFTYPIGILALFAGAVIGIGSVGAGFIFGGIFALSDGCFSSWEVMPGLTRYIALLFVLLLLVALGIILERRKPNPIPPAPVV